MNDGDPEDSGESGDSSSSSDDSDYSDEDPFAFGNFVDTPINSQNGTSEDIISIGANEAGGKQGASPSAYQSPPSPVNHGGFDITSGNAFGLSSPGGTGGWGSDTRTCEDDFGFPVTCFANIFLNHKNTCCNINNLFF